jgi:hypothetical protein
MERSKAKLWFDYLKLADRLGEKVDWEFYKEWGTAEEIRSLSFNKWWNTKGKALLTVEKTMEVVGTDDQYVIVRIPLSWDVRKIRDNLGVVTKHLRKDLRKGLSKYEVTGRYSYPDFVSYKRMLELKLSVVDDLDRMTMEKLIAIFKSEENKRVTKQTKINNKLQSKKQSINQKLRRSRSSIKTDKITIRTGNEWVRKGKRIAANVAKGQFSI